MHEKSTMEFLLLHVCIILSVALMACHAALPGEVYWNSVLPNTPMPKGVKDLLQPDEWAEDKSTSVSVGKGGVNVNTGKGKSGGTHMNVGRKGGVGVDTGRKPEGGGTHVSVGHKGGVGVSTGKPGKGGTNVGVGKGGVHVGTGHKGKPVIVNVKPGPSPFNYLYAANEDQLHDDRSMALFFLESDLHQGTNMNLHFIKTSNGKATFLPRNEAKSIPFSTSKFQDILDQYSLKPDSPEAKVMKNTIQECESPGIEGEDKFCATSLESMVDYTTQKLGRNIEAVSTETEKETNILEYSVSGVKKMGIDKSVVCHKTNYAYAVFYCHKSEATETYKVSLVGKDGTKAEAVAVCHKNTSGWNPKHLAFQVLKVKPGTVPICHFLPEDHIVWVQK